ncbi:hypothetical protein Pla100_58150 [Neorhodopirellula pilleata]|uniref:Uncharacterized protein n=1 Tax=Neorhodopirellula pilleata TaxID=2714738 RepID=A0A5C5ZNE7_9BACT|nr:hypothetical protein Pla100_58150 [Neorhodopirellula pilleata]
MAFDPSLTHSEVCAFFSNPLRKRGIIDMDSSLAYAAGYDQINSTLHVRLTPKLKFDAPLLGRFIEMVPIAVVVLALAVLNNFLWEIAFSLLG